MSGVSSLRSVHRRSLHDDVVEQLRDYVVEGDIQAGQKIPELELCEQLGISRTPLREALKVLAADRLITLIPNRGAVVRELTRADIEEVFPVIGTLEALAGELACQHITDKEIARLRKLHEKMVAHYLAGDRSHYFHCNREIHELILRAARNETLSAHYQSLATRLRRARYLANMSAERWAQAVREHEAILDAITNRDGRALSLILKQHLSLTFAAVLDRLAD